MASPENLKSPADLGLSPTSFLEGAFLGVLTLHIESDDLDVEDHLLAKDRFKGNQTRPDQRLEDVTVKNVSETKAELSALLVLVEQGEEIVIARAGKPVAKLVQYEQKRPDRVLGRLKGKIWISPDFNEPCPEIERMFNGEET